MAAEHSDIHAPEIEWDELAPGGEVSATVLMASGFALPRGSKVRERYKVVGALGEGMMGQVLAVQLLGHDDPQTYALKVVARRGDEADDDEAASQAAAYAELLRQEAAKQEIVQRNGVAVARLFALVQLDDGAIGMRMERARGRSLEAWIEDARQDLRAPADVFRAVTVVRKLVSQLRRLHEIVDPGSPTGFVHCDVKPGNVFVDESDPADLSVTLLDFGVATAGHALAAGLQTRGGSSGRKTFIMQETGGTLGYAPPKHFTRKATPLSDIHASLVILYELVALGLPWPLANTGDDYTDVIDLEKRMETTAPRPLRAVRPSVPSRDATLLDDFFRREFTALHRLNESAARSNAGNDAASKRATASALAQLARQYQAKLDELSTNFAPRGRTSSPQFQVKEPSKIQRVVVLGEPTPPPQPPPKLEISADATAAVPLVRAQGGSGLVAKPALDKPAQPATSAPPANPNAPDSTTALPLMRTSPVRADAPPASPAPAFAASTAKPATGADTSSVFPPAAPQSVAARTDDPSFHSQPALPLLRKVVVRPSDPGRPKSRAVLYALVPVAMIAGAFAAYLSLGRRESAASEAHRCTCEAPAAGVRVVARGGTLTSEAEVCVARAPGAAGFTGQGSISPDVLRALPVFECLGGTGGRPLTLTMERVTGAGGAQTTAFRCTR